MEKMIFICSLTFSANVLFVIYLLLIFGADALRVGPSSSVALSFHFSCTSQAPAQPEPRRDH